MQIIADERCPILPPATLGVLGGGQLGRFFVIAARQMGYSVWVLDPDKHSPAGALANRHLCADYSDTDALDQMAQACAAMTTEFENVPAAALEYFCKFMPVRPRPETVALCQNRVAEKCFLRDNGLPHAPFLVVKSSDDLQQASAELFPGILKVARFGYDGKGQGVVNSREEAQALWQQVFGREPCVLEKKLSLDGEISVVLARDSRGDVSCFPAVENVHCNGILDISIVPARVFGRPGCVRADAGKLAENVAVAMAYEGVLAVEFFVSGGELYINEMAPRPHNSGHYTIDACATSQFEQQLRLMCDLPLGQPVAHSAAVMVNLLGDLWFENGARREPDWMKLFAVPGLKLHLYGKHEARPGRKMGHFTVLDADPVKAYERALAARRLIGIGTDDGGLS